MAAFQPGREARRDKAQLQRLQDLDKAFFPLGATKQPPGTAAGLRQSQVGGEGTADLAVGPSGRERERGVGVVQGVAHAVSSTAMQCRPSCCCDGPPVGWARRCGATMEGSGSGLRACCWELGCM